MSLFSPFIRAINYHDVPPSHAGLFDEQLKYFAKMFSPVTEADLLAFHEGTWNKPKPGMIISFDDGFRSFVGEIRIYRLVLHSAQPGGLSGRRASSSCRTQQNQIRPKSNGNADARVFLTWDQLKELAERHVIGSHTLTHCQLKDDLDEETLRLEINESKKFLEQNLGREIKTFAWVGGEESSYSRKAGDIIRDTGYELVFLTNNSIIRPDTDLTLLASQSGIPLTAGSSPGSARTGVAYH